MDVRQAPAWHRPPIGSGDHSPAASRIIGLNRRHRAHHRRHRHVRYFNYLARRQVRGAKPRADYRNPLVDALCDLATMADCCQFAAAPAGMPHLCARTFAPLTTPRRHATAIRQICGIEVAWAGRCSGVVPHPPRPSRNDRRGIISPSIPVGSGKTISTRPAGTCRPGALSAAFSSNVARASQLAMSLQSSDTPKFKVAMHSKVGKPTYRVRPNHLERLFCLDRQIRKLRIRCACTTGSAAKKRGHRDLATAGRPFRRFRCHDLAHGDAIRYLKNGGGIYALSQQLGHSSVKTTEIYLGFLTIEEKQRAMRGERSDTILVCTCPCVVSSVV